MVQPYKNSTETKKGQVTAMFNNIALRYDLLNHLLSFNIDKYWRRIAVNMLMPYNPRNILDVATGTGDFAIAASKFESVKITGIDISSGMLRIGREKIIKLNLDNRIELLQADSEELPFKDNTFDAAIVAFGVRNFENLTKGLTEVFRVLVEGGVFVVLEFSKPKMMPFRLLYDFYFKTVLPVVGKLISKDSSAYEYLPASVDAFPEDVLFLVILEECGYVNCRMKRLTFGIASIYIGEKAGKT